MGFVKNTFGGGNFWKVDMQLLPIKVHYFIFFAALGCVLPFRTVFAKQLGISATAVGVIFLAVPFMKLLTNPLCGVIGDYFKRFRLLIATLIALVAASHLAMIYIPPMEISPAAQLTTNVRVSVVYDASSDGIALHAIASLDDKYLTRPVDVTCRMMCGIKEKNSICGEGPNMTASIHISADSCMLHFDFFNMSLANNSTKRESFPFLHYEEVGSLRHDCSGINGTTDTMNSTSPDKIFDAHRRWVIKDRSGCPMTENLSCIVEKCRDSEDLLVEVENEFFSVQVWGLFLMIAVSSTSFCAVLFLIDALCYEMLQNKKTDYGRQRLWGTIGWGAGAFFGGYLNQLISHDASVIDYSLSFYLLVVLMIIDLIPVSQLKVDEIKYSPNICKDICILFSQPYIAYYMTIVFVSGILSGLVWNYQFWFLEEIGASQMLLGLSQVTECLVELPCFVIAGWVIKKIGYDNCNNMSLLCFGLRYLSLAYMYDPWLVLPLGIFNGPSFGIFFAAITMFGKKEAPPGTEATIQALLSVAFEGVGCGLGSVLGGVGFDRIGSRKTFLYSAIASFAFMAINIVVQILMRKKRS